MQGREDTVVYNVDCSLQEPHLILWGISWSLSLRSPLQATHESPINNEIILKEVKAALLSDKVAKNYKLLLKSSLREFEKSLQD